MSTKRRWVCRGLVRVIRVAAAAGLLAAVAVALLLGLLWVDHLRETRLPEPTGPFAVGRTLRAWVREGPSDPRGPSSDAGRVLLAWIWYPAAAPSPSRREADYLLPRWREAVERQRGVLLTQFLTRDLSRVRAHSRDDVELSPARTAYPVVLLRAGLAALTTNYTALAEDLASHGYVVVGIDAPLRTTVVVLPNGRVVARAPRYNADLVGGAEKERLAADLVRAWSSDLSFALDQLVRLDAFDPGSRFQGRLDLERVGIVGHSLGGATALQFCHDDPRCKAGIDVDGAPVGSVVRDGVRRPCMFLLGDHRGEPAAEVRRVEADIRSLYDRLPPDRRVRWTIRGAGHYQFSDDGALLKSPLAMRVLRLAGAVHLDGRRQLAVTAHGIAAFFDVHLAGAPAARLEDLGGYPEVERAP